MNILAIGAHPDDIELFCAGTLLKYRGGGHKIFCVLATSGSIGSNIYTGAWVHFVPETYVGISSLMDKKLEALGKHKSQFAWMSTFEEQSLFDICRIISEFSGLQAERSASNLSGDIVTDLGAMLRGGGMEFAAGGNITRKRTFSPDVRAGPPLVSTQVCWQGNCESRCRNRGRAPAAGASRAAKRARLHQSGRARRPCGGHGPDRVRRARTDEIGQAILGRQ